jgi:hypothetical protein
VVTITLAPSLSAQLVVYSFSGNTAAATSTGSSVTASSFTGSNSPSLSNSSPVSSGSGSYYITQTGWTGLSPGINYFEFTLTPNSGYSLTLSSVSFLSRSSPTGPTAYYFRSSADAYVSDLKSGALINDFAWYATGNQSISLTSISATTFRLYANAASAGGGTLRIDDFTANGTVSAIPEPSTYAALLGVFALGVGFLYRRRQKTA